MNQLEIPNNRAKQKGESMTAINEMFHGGFKKIKNNNKSETVNTFTCYCRKGTVKSS